MSAWTAKVLPAVGRERRCTIPTIGSDGSGGGGDDDAIVGGPSSSSTSGSSSAAEPAASENGSGIEVASAGSSSGVAAASTSASTSSAGSSGGSSGSSGSSADGATSVTYAAAGTSPSSRSSSSTSTSAVASGLTGAGSGGVAAAADVEADDEPAAAGSHEEAAPVPWYQRWYNGARDYVYSQTIGQWDVLQQKFADNGAKVGAMQGMLQSNNSAIDAQRFDMDRAPSCGTLPTRIATFPSRIIERAKRGFAELIWGKCARVR